MQITMTASTLLEAAEPTILWKHLLKGILNAINSSEHQLEVCQRAALSFFSLIQYLLGHQSNVIPSPFSPHARRGSEEHSLTCDFRRFDGNLICESLTASASHI
jgi:hypothetical protein